jgi:uncharacterized protein
LHIWSGLGRIRFAYNSRQVNFTVTGATGFIGRRLVRRLLADGHTVHVLSRRGRTVFGPEVRTSFWDPEKQDPPLASLSAADSVIHLAGEPVAQRWTPVAKQRILASRAEGTRRLAAALAELPRRPKALVSASAVGYYGSRGDERLSEISGPGRGFLSEVCIQWEKCAKEAEPLGIRVVRLRIGVVLGKEGGALARMLPAFQWGTGGRLGSGKQWMSWIHVDDLVSLILFAAQNPSLRGPVNATTPNPVTNAQFTAALAEVLHRPALIPAPAFAIRTLFGEMAEILLEGQMVLPESALAAGFEFRYPDLKPALGQLLA